MIKILSTSFLALFISLANPHDYHVSITEMHYNSDFKTLTISHQLFIDDLQRVLADRQEDVAVGLENSNKETVQIVVDYIRSNFKLTVNANKLLTPDYVGFEWEDHHGLWFYFEAKNVDDITSVKIENTFFIDLFDDQENMHYFYKNKNKSDLLLNREKTSGMLEFE